MNSLARLLVTMEGLGREGLVRDWNTKQCKHSVKLTRGGRVVAGTQDILNRALEGLNKSLRSLNKKRSDF